ncbi:serine-rich aggregation substance UasX [Leuconostoc citreum]|uniref:serine-rich aggregation substance UasX n=1 Tax=Leuconostoc citreum TaxID=33964 RepID=UPI0032E02AEC
MLKQTLLVSGAVLGALTFSSQAVHADTVDVNDGISTGTSQPSTQPSDTGSTTLPPANTDIGSNTGNSGSGTSQSGVNDGTIIDNGSSSSSTDNGSNSSSTDDKGNGSNSSSTDDKGNSSNSSSTDDKGNGSNSSSTDDKGNGSNSSSTDDKGNGSNSSNTDDDKLPNNGKAPDVVPLTPTTPDVNDKGQLNQVAPVPVAQPNQGQAPVVPEQVATVPSVARAVEAYNATLSSNNSDATKAPVIEAKKQVDDAVIKALPKTGVRQKQSSVSVLGVALTALASGLAFVFKKKLG